MIESVQAFHAKFDLPTGDKDYLTGDPMTTKFRSKFLQEELDEFVASMENEDKVAAFDALLDLAYVTYGTALFLGISPEQWYQGFAAVQHAYMTKVRADSALDTRSKRKNSFDVVKPEGWAGPEMTLKDILYGKTTGRNRSHRMLEHLSTKEMFEGIQKRGGHPGALAEAALLCIKKSEDYNGECSDPHKVDRSNYFPFGVMSYGHMIHTKAQRFISLCEARISGRPINFEGLKDTALDLINYAGFFIASEQEKKDEE